MKRRRLGNLDGNSDCGVHDGSDLCPENAECAESTCHVTKLNTPLDTGKVNVRNFTLSGTEEQLSAEDRYEHESNV